MMPLCDKTVTPPSCTAKGTYINDDGLTLDMTERHTYTIAYSHNISATVGAAPDKMEIVITG